MGTCSGITERKDAYLVTAELPGVGPADLEVTFQDGPLTIQGERHPAGDAAGDKVHRAERRYGAFRRSINLPSHGQADKIEATAPDGLLRILVSKAAGRAPGASRCSQARPNPQ